MKKNVTLAAIAALVLMAVSAYAATYDWTYEGNAVPPAGDTATWGTAPTVSSDGNILTVDFATPTETNDHWHYWTPGFSNTAATWTVDYRMARPIAAGSWGNTPNVPNYINVYAADAGGATGGRISLYLGRVGYGGLGGIRLGDSEPYDDSSTLSIYTAENGDQEIVVPGLNVGELNSYRIVGTGGSNYKIYVNGIATPVYTGTLANSAGFGAVIVGATLSAATPETDMDMKLDYIRVNNSTAFDEAPLNAGIEGQITIENFVNNADKLSLAPIRVELMQGGIVVATQTVTLATNPGGYLFAGLAAGTYDLRFTSTRCLRKLVTGIVVNDGVRTPVDVTLINGDVDGDNALTTTDLSAVLQHVDATGN